MRVTVTTSSCCIYLQAYCIFRDEMKVSENIAYFDELVAKKLRNNKVNLACRMENSQPKFS